MTRSETIHPMTAIELAEAAMVHAQSEYLRAMAQYNQIVAVCTPRHALAWVSDRSEDKERDKSRKMDVKGD